jgi:hypothetical protein
MSNTLISGQELTAGNSLTSPSGRYQLILQSDGNLVIYDLGEDNRATWSSRTNGQAVSKAVMQTDGNFVIYGPDANALWATNTSSINTAILTLQDDGNLVIYEWIEPELWNSGSGGL